MAENYGYRPYPHTKRFHKEYIGFMNGFLMIENNMDPFAKEDSL